MTVVVPTRDRPEALAACLDALARQEVTLEVVVVDDGSVDAAAVAAVVERHPATRLVRGEGRGPAVARNHGASEATAGVVAFTDDDCRPRPAWAAALVTRLREAADVAAVAGPTEVATTAPAVVRAAQVVTNHLVADSLDTGTGRLGFAPTSNLAVRREVHQRFPFDESFPLAAGEDREWCSRLAAAGEVVVFEPEAVVDHHPDLDLRRFWRQQERYGRGAVHHRTASGEGLAGPGFYARLLRRGLAEGPAVGASVALAQVATATGVVRERLTR